MTTGQPIWLVVCRMPIGDDYVNAAGEEAYTHRIVAAYIAEDVALQHARLANEQKAWLKVQVADRARGDLINYPGLFVGCNQWDASPEHWYGILYEVIESRLWLHPDQYLDHASEGVKG